jgi:hypothetical protein
MTKTKTKTKTKTYDLNGFATEVHNTLGRVTSIKIGDKDFMIAHGKESYRRVMYNDNNYNHDNTMAVLFEPEHGDNDNKMPKHRKRSNSFKLHDVEIKKQNGGTNVIVCVGDTVFVVEYSKPTKDLPAIKIGLWNRDDTGPVYKGVPVPLSDIASMEGVSNESN